MNGRTLWSFARRWVWLLLVGALLAATVSYVVSSRLPKVYEARAKLLVGAGRIDVRLTDFGDVQAASMLTPTYAALIKTQSVVDAAARATGLDERAIKVDATAQRDTQILEISVRAGDPEQAAVFANAVAEAFISQQQAVQLGRFAAGEQRLVTQLDQLSTSIAERSGALEAMRAQPPGADRDANIAQLQGELAATQQIYTTASRSLEDLRLTEAHTTNLVTVADPATPASFPIEPRVSVNVLIAALAGFLGAAGTAYLLQRLDDRVLSSERLVERVGLQPLGTVAALSEGTLWGLERSRQVGEERYATAQVAEEFRLLWTYMRVMDDDRVLQSVLVTSSTAGEGKTSTAANLAIVAARAGQTVLLVDADLRRPSLHEVFGASNRLGLTNLLVEEDMPAAVAVKESGVPGLRLLPSGPTVPGPSGLLASATMCARLSELRAMADLLVIDSAPTLAVSDPAVLAGLVDGTLLVVDAQTRAAQVTEAMDILEQAGAHLLGVVLNRVVSHRPRYYGSYASDTPASPTPVDTPEASTLPTAPLTNTEAPGEP